MREIRAKLKEICHGNYIYIMGKKKGDEWEEDGYREWLVGWLVGEGRENTGRRQWLKGTREREGECMEKAEWKAKAHDLQ